jgi:hypothetical protein
MTSAFAATAGGRFDDVLKSLARLSSSRAAAFRRSPGLLGGLGDIFDGLFGKPS